MMLCQMGLEVKILDMKIENSKETLWTDYPLMQHNIPEEFNPQHHNCKDPKTEQQVIIKYCNDICIQDCMVSQLFNSLI